MKFNREEGFNSMQNSKYDPERIHQRKIIFWAVAIVLVIALLGFGYGWVHHEHRTSTAKQQAMMNSNEPVVVMFYSKTCSHCKKVAFTANKNSVMGQIDSWVGSIMTDPNSAHQHKVMFVEYQNKTDQKTFSKYGVTETPTFMVLKNGQPQQISTVNGTPVYKYSGTDKDQIKNLYHTLQTGSNQVAPQNN